ncbi:Plastocyanin [Marinobacter sp. LV10R510-11A]|uniref:hypothetical protein n=1 Tax=Marinobacter sp. LV10R510-11A TaxID=1415568 RepID=UPI000BB75525|nr:hypothetical protein [Marinobacter sp. LV10R510-11A]SOB75418.1 Plastocyanin [Marinobacter sp. LV10R510-11A]
MTDSTPPLVHVSRRNLIQSAIIGTAALSTMSPSMALAKAKMPDHEGLVFRGEGFQPMVLKLVAGESLPIVNRGNQGLSLVSAPGAPEPIKAQIKPGEKKNLKWPKPGIYLLYDDQTTRFDSKVGQVVARNESPYFPLPAYAAVVVTDEHGGGIPFSAKAQVDIPDSYLTFEPWALVVKAGAPIQFVNEDMDMHIAMPSVEPMLMPDRKAGPGEGNQPWMEQMEAFAPVNLPGNGGKGIVTLGTPGVYHYYCPIHAAYNATAGTYAPLKSYGGYPFIMDGLLVVEPV